MFFHFCTVFYKNILCQKVHFVALWFHIDGTSIGKCIGHCVLYGFESWIGVLIQAMEWSIGVDTWSGTLE